MKEGYGDFIKKHRLTSGYKSQRRLAEKTGISPATISRIEKEIQKPEARTLKQLAPYLTSTSLVDLMVVCGYWDEDELLEDHKGNELIHLEESKKESSSNNEEEFIESIDLTDKEILEQFNLTLDGKSLTEEETIGIIAYLRMVRQMKS